MASGEAGAWGRVPGGGGFWGGGGLWIWAKAHQPHLISVAAPRGPRGGEGGGAGGLAFGSDAGGAPWQPGRGAGEEGGGGGGGGGGVPVWAAGDAKEAAG